MLYIWFKSEIIVVIFIIFTFTLRMADTVCFCFFLWWITLSWKLETTDTASSASFLDLYLEFDDSGQLSTKIYDKRDDFNFKIINFPNMCSNIPASPAYAVYISDWFAMQGPVTIILISWNVIFIWETGYWTRAMNRFALFDLLKSLYSDTKILSKYIPSLQKRL
jgi:hypothetical protein